MTTGSVDTWTGYASYDWGNRCMPGIFIKSGDHAFEPTPEMARLKELGAQIVVETDDAARDAEIKEVIQIWKDGLYAIGIGRRLPGIVVISEKLRAQRGHLRRRLGLWRERLQPRRRILVRRGRAVKN